MDRALLVGINAYPTSVGRLDGCVHDVEHWADFLCERMKFRERDIRMLCDTRATRDAMMERLHWLVRDAKAGARILFMYSGHGAQVASRNPEGEVDRLDEVLCPVDFDWEDAHLIRDDDLSALFGAMPKGVRCTWVIDACHSGTELDPAPVDWNARRSRTPRAATRDIDWRRRTALTKNLVPRAIHASSPVTLLAACRDSEVAADLGKGGAFSTALIETLRKKPKDPVRAIIHAATKRLRELGVTQHPTVHPSGSKPFLG